MPGSSLWLVPPPDSALYAALSTLITTSIPSIYPNANPFTFHPHITLTADTVAAPSSTSKGPTPEEIQQWLDGLDLPSTTTINLNVQIKEPQVGTPFFRKLTLRCENTSELKALAAACRKKAGSGTGFGEEEVQCWVEVEYGPHASLM